MSDRTIEADIDPIGLVSIMLLPDDPQPIRASSAIKIGRECEDARELVGFDDAMEYVVDRYLAGKSSDEGMDNGAAGAVAGDVLLYLIQMDKQGVKEPSLRKARCLAADYTKAAVHDGSQKIGYTDASIKSHWRKFRCVAHLWAASRIIQFEGGDPHSDETAERLAYSTASLLSIAKTLEHYADQFVPTRERNPEPLLSRKVYCIGDSVEAADIGVPPLQDWVTTALDSYSNDRNK